MYINIWSIWRVKEHKNLKEPLLKLDDSTGPRPLHIVGWLCEEPIPKLTYKNAAKCSGALYWSKWAWVVFNTRSQMNQCDMLPSDLAGQTAYKQDHKNQCVLPENVVPITRGSNNTECTFSSPWRTIHHMERPDQKIQLIWAIAEVINFTIPVCQEVQQQVGLSLCSHFPLNLSHVVLQDI